MFGSKEKELESRLISARLDLEKMTEDKKKIEKDLEAARSELAGLKAKFGDSDLEALREKAMETITAHEALKELYSAKIRDFDDSKEKEEERFAREQARKRAPMDREIDAIRRENQKQISSSVDTFNDTYNYYLNQIKVLMDALSQVTVQSGKTMLHQDKENLKTEFSHQLVEALKSGANTLGGQDGNLIVIGTGDREIELPESCAGAPEPEPAAAPAEAKAAEAAESPAEPSESPVEASVEEAEIDSKDFRKIVDFYTEEDGKVSYDRLSGDLLQFARNSNRTRGMIKAKESADSIRLYTLETKFKTITGNKKLTDEEILRIVELMNKMSPKDVLGDLNDYLRKHLETEEA